MHYTIEGLIQGDSDIVRHYQNAKKIWNKIIHSDSFKSVDSLADELTVRQTEFELECGGRYIGQEIMVVAGISQFYTTANGFEENLNTVRKIRDAFKKSMCSVEVKHYIKEVSKIYEID